MTFVLPLLSVVSFVLAAAWIAAPGLAPLERARRFVASALLWGAVVYAAYEHHPQAAVAIAPAATFGFMGFVVVRALTRAVREVRASEAMLEGVEQAPDRRADG